MTDENIFCSLLLINLNFSVLCVKGMRSTFRTPLQKHALVKSTYAEDYDYSSAEKEKIRKQNIIKRERFYVVRFSDVEVLVYRKTV